MRKLLSDKKIVIIGGCGHVGLPLGVKFALAGAKTVLVDISEKAVANVNSGKFPFVEHNGDEQLQEAISLGLKASTNPAECSDANVIVFVTGTPVDEHLNPKISDVVKIFDVYQQYFSPKALVVMRSTLFPGTMEHLNNRVKQNKTDILLSFCPERVAQGIALDEIDSLPQIVSAFDEESFEAAYKLFSALAPEIIRLSPIEAELTKLMANSWRYLEFAIANQFYMIAESKGVDFYKIYQAIRYDYPRAKGYKSPGFAAGPCLFKDTMQLASYFNHQFYMGHSAMLVNEGLATFIAEKAVKTAGGSLWGKKVGLLGLTFKADNDDIRESLSFRVKKALEFHGAEILANDPYLDDTYDLDYVLQNSDLFVLGTPHSEYKKITLNKPFVDVWGFFMQPELKVLPGNVEFAQDENTERKIVNK
ncbi:MAG: nucleotide sugar dehydrogenase [Proteobacteria bacterium]|nr:nucleotide sugar dehydrogenase [Pseudomonadota bacterium]